MRPSLQHWAMDIAMATARRTTCLRRGVGCVLLNSKGHVLATGYNGVPRGTPHCTDRVLGPLVDVGLSGAGVAGRAVTFPHACPAASAPSGTALGGCKAIHAEQNALLQCSAVDDIDVAVVTTSPCIHCVKMLMNTGCRDIFYHDPYPGWEEIGQMWQESRHDRLWVQLKEQK